MKPKARTMQERLGFVDDELSTPKHDEMLLWFHENSAKIIANLFPPEWAASEQLVHEQIAHRERAAWGEEHGLTPEEAKSLVLLKGEILHWHRHNEIEKEQEFKNQLGELLNTSAKRWPDPGPPPPRPPFKIEAKQWEVPIKTGNYINGYVDIVITGREGHVNLNGLWAPAWTTSYQRAVLLFEIKPSIRSLGELVRQINTYRAYETNSQCFVVSPDERFEQHLASQRIRFVKYTG
jgi:hypothetical protein